MVMSELSLLQRTESLAQVSLSTHTTHTHTHTQPLGSLKSNNGFRNTDLSAWTAYQKPELLYFHFCALLASVVPLLTGRLCPTETCQPRQGAPLPQARMPTAVRKELLFARSSTKVSGMGLIGVGSRVPITGPGGER